MGTQVLERKEADFFIGKNKGEGITSVHPIKGKFAPATSPALFGEYNATMYKM